MRQRNEGSEDDLWLQSCTSTLADEVADEREQTEVERRTTKQWIRERAFREKLSGMKCPGRRSVREDEVSGPENWAMSCSRSQGALSSHWSQCRYSSAFPEKIRVKYGRKRWSTLFVMMREQKFPNSRNL